MAAGSLIPEIPEHRAPSAPPPLTEKEIDERVSDVSTESDFVRLIVSGCRSRKLLRQKSHVVWRNMNVSVKWSANAKRKLCRHSVKQSLIVAALCHGIRRQNSSRLLSSHPLRVPVPVFIAMLMFHARRAKMTSGRGCRIWRTRCKSPLTGLHVFCS